jgi:hypothetical protein
VEHSLVRKGGAMIPIIGWIIAVYAIIRLIQIPIEASKAVSIQAVLSVIGICTIGLLGFMLLRADVGVSTALAPLTFTTPQTKPASPAFGPQQLEEPRGLPKTGHGFPSEDPSLPWACNKATYDERLCKAAMKGRR